MSFPQWPVFLPMRNRLEVTEYSSRNSIGRGKNSDSRLGHRLEGEYNEKLDWRSEGVGETKGTDGIKKLDAST
jgi:hypothetical protein